MLPFTDLSDISRLVDARTRSISAENPRGEKGRGGMATDGPARGRRTRPRPGLEGLAVHASCRPAR